MTTLGRLLFEEIAARGVDRTFGIPGDFVLPLYAAQEAFGMATVVCAHEPNAVYAADSYARIRGLGVVLTTYGAGGLNMVNPVAMAYAEYSPVLVISGAPDCAQRENETFLHHRVRDFDTQFRVFSEVTVDAAVIKNLADARSLIPRVIESVVSQHRPGYLEISRDLVHCLLPELAHATARPWHSGREALAECADELDRLLRAAERPMLYAGVGVRRNKLMDEIRALAEGYGLEVVTSVLGKGCFPESHSHYRGMFMGELGRKDVQERVMSADLVLKVGVLDTDVNTGFWTGVIPTSRLAALHERSVEVFHHRYEGLAMEDLVRELLARAAANPPTRRDGMSESLLAAKKGCSCACAEKRASGEMAKLSPALPSPALPSPDESARPLTQSAILAGLKRLPLERFRVLADVGDSWFLGLELPADEFLAPGYYASMGFAVPGALGAALADRHLRPLVLVGDGAFQMTANELGTLAAQGLNPILVLLNNNGYQMLSALDKPRSYYEIAPWDYTALARSMGCEAWRVAREEDFAPALEAALASQKPALIEAVIAPEDRSPIMTRIQEFMARKAKAALAIQA